MTPRGETDRHPENPRPTTVRVGVFRGPKEAERAVYRLQAAGYPIDAISVVCPQCHEGELRGPRHVEPAGERTPEALAIGGGLGAVVGGLGTAAALTASGAGVLVLGPLLAGAAAGSIAGGFIGAMTTRGFEREVADFYDQALDEGRVLVAVEAGRGADRPPLRVAERVLEEAGAEPVRLSEG